MNNKFDELTKGMAQSVTRRAALKKFGLGLAGTALACFGLANTAEASEAMINHGLRRWARMERKQNSRNPCHPWSKQQQETKQTKGKT